MVDGRPAALIRVDAKSMPQPASWSLNWSSHTYPLVDVFWPRSAKTPAHSVSRVPTFCEPTIQHDLSTIHRPTEQAFGQTPPWLVVSALRPEAARGLQQRDKITQCWPYRP